MKDSVKDQKRLVIDEIKENIQNAKSTTLVSYTGLSVTEITELRDKYTASNANYKVYKNTMMRFAFEELGFDQFTDLLNGPNALIFSNEDLVAGPKVTQDFITENDDNKEKIEIKGGVVEGDFQDATKMVAISKLPSKEVLLTQLVYTMQAPIRKLVQDSNQIIAKIVYAIDAIKEKKENEEA